MNSLVQPITASNLDSIPTPTVGNSPVLAILEAAIDRARAGEAFTTESLGGIAYQLRNVAIEIEGAQSDDEIASVDERFQNMPELPTVEAEWEVIVPHKSHLKQIFTGTHKQCRKFQKRWNRHNKPFASCFHIDESSRLPRPGRCYAAKGKQRLLAVMNAATQALEMDFFGDVADFAQLSKYFIRECQITDRWASYEACETHFNEAFAEGWTNEELSAFLDSKLK